MTGYGLVNLKDMIQELGEGRTKEILSEFSCPLNKDVEFFCIARPLNLPGRELPRRSWW